MPLKNKPNDSDLKTLVYCKYLYIQGSKFLENKTNGAFFNLSVIMFSNAVELAIKIIDRCLGNKRKYSESISKITEDIQKNPLNIELPYTDIYNLFIHRNSIYHNGKLLIYESCFALKEESLNTLSNIYKILFGKEDFYKISIADLIQDDVVKILLKESEELLNREEYEESIFKSTEAFVRFRFRLYKRSDADKYIFTQGIDVDKFDWKWVEDRFVETRVQNKDLDYFSVHAEDIIQKKFERFSENLDLLFLLRNHYEEYKYFQRNSPINALLVNLDNLDDIEINFDKKNVKHIIFSKEIAEFIISFTVNVVLELEPQLKPIIIKYFSGEIFKTID